ncbi:DUF4468 domain-containing protein [Sphingobacterium multivorum]|uniref:DUF4468 domain-containing protein n=1 Tax=Sphingobacterium multivorum TaxID=28454 RepID=UPI003DA23385
MNEGVIEYKEVVEVPKSSKKDIFLKTQIFFANTFRSAKNVIDLNDPESGIIIGSGNFIIHPTYLGIPQDELIRFTIKVECKDDRYRYTINSFSNSLHNLNELNSYADGTKKNLNTPKKYAIKIINGIDLKINEIINSLKKETSKTTNEEDF